jgi:hypothetical protein
MHHARHSWFSMQVAQLIIRHAGVIFGCVVMTALGVAAVLKSLRFEEFTLSLSSWTLLPESLHIVIAIGVIGLEAMLVVAWFAGGMRNEPLLGATALIGAYTAFFAVQWIVSGPPKCECFGLLMAYQSTLNENVSVLVRNGVMLGVCVIALSLRRQEVLMHRTSAETSRA